MHVCYISQEYPPESGWGGIGAYTYEMAHGLTRAGHQVTVLSRALEAESITDDDGVTVHRLFSRPDWNRYRGLWRLHGIWPGFAWGAWSRLKEINQRERIDVVESAENRADAFFVPFSSLAKRLVVRLHMAWKFADQASFVTVEAKKRIVYWEEKQLVERSALVTSPSKAMLDLTRTWAEPRHAEVIPNPVDTKLFSPGTASGSGEVLFVGRLEERKGVESLVTAVPQVLQSCKEATFRFIGGDEGDRYGVLWRERLRAAVPEDDWARLHFELVPRAELPGRYRQAAVCVLPSRWENFPYALLEAMACGKPVVATNSGGVPEMVRDGEDGSLVAPGDAVLLADALCELLKDEPRRKAMGERGRTRVVSEFSTEVVVPRMLKAYVHLIEASHDG